MGPGVNRVGYLHHSGFAGAILVTARWLNGGSREAVETYREWGSSVERDRWGWWVLISIFFFSLFLLPKIPHMTRFFSYFLINFLFFFFLLFLNLLYIFLFSLFLMLLNYINTYYNYNFNSNSNILKVRILHLFSFSTL